MSTYSEIHQLAPGDILIAPKSFFGIIKHLIVFCGYDQSGEDLYLENNPQCGVQWLTGTEVLSHFKIIGFRKFSGDETDRDLAIQRAESMVGAQYDLFKFNCEHFANLVQTGVSISRQSDNGRGLVALGLSLLLISKL